LKFIEKRVPIDGYNGEFRLDWYGDTHFGSSSVDERTLEDDVQRTRDNNRFWAFGGDGVDGILPDDTRRFDSGNISDWAWAAHKDHKLISAEYARWAEVFGPIADKCLFYAKGDGKHNRHENVDDCRDAMLQRVGIPGAYQGVYYTFKFYRTATSMVSVPLLFHHSRITGTDGNKVNRLERLMNSWPEVWGVFVGHGHSKAQTPPVIGMVERGGKSSAIHRKGAMTGSYLRTYADDTIGYGETALYPPVALGHITIVIRPFCRDLRRRIEIENA